MMGYLINLELVTIIEGNYIIDLIEEGLTYSFKFI